MLHTKDIYNYFVLIEVEDKLRVIYRRQKCIELVLAKLEFSVGVIIILGYIYH